MSLSLDFLGAWLYYLWRLRKSWNANVARSPRGKWKVDHVVGVAARANGCVAGIVDAWKATPRAARSSAGTARRNVRRLLAGPVGVVVIAGNPAPRTAPRTVRGTVSVIPPTGKRGGVRLLDEILGHFWTSSGPSHGSSLRLGGGQVCPICRPGSASM